MAIRFTVLGSGSGGNASLLEIDGFGLLIDAGLGPRQIASRLDSLGAGWPSIQAAILTHTHTDHWKETTFAQFIRREIPLYCHPHHMRRLGQASQAFDEMTSAGLIRTYRADESNPLGGRIRVRPFRLSHDGGATFGFRFEADPGRIARSWSMAYAADLGMWHAALVDCLRDVDLLALEFNHDVAMQRSSGRPQQLIARVLGDEGHLSNEQAGELLGEVVRASQPARLQHVVQLHLSRQCNRPRLARQAATYALNSHGNGVGIHTADQDRPLVVDDSTQLTSHG